MGHNLTIILLSISLILICSKFLGEITKKLFKSSLLGEISAGILLGQSVFGYFFPDYYNLTFNEKGFKEFLSLFNSISVIMLLLIAGMESDMRSILKQKVIVIAAPLKIFFAILVSYVVFGFLINLNFNNIDRDLFILSMGFAISITALPVLVRILSELNIYRSDLGMSLVGTAMFIDVMIWLGFSVVMIISRKSQSSGLFGIVLKIVITVFFVVLILTVIRRYVDKMLPIIQSKFSWPDGVIAFVFSLCFLFATITESLGAHAIVGAFLSGLIISDSMHFRDKIQAKIEGIVNAFFAPIYFGSLGLYLNFFKNIDLRLTFLFIFLGFLVSFLAGFFPHYKINGSKRESIAYGYGLSIWGATDIIFMSILFSLHFVNEKVLASYILSVLLIVLFSPIVLRLILPTRYHYKFYDYLSEKLYIPNIHAKTDKEAIEELTKSICDLHKLDYETIKNLVLERESLMPTGIGNGVAIPHARVEGIKKPIIAVGISEIGIDFGSRDGDAAHLIFLILTPKQDTQVQLEILADIAKTFKYFEPHSLVGLKTLHQFIAFVRTELWNK
ncbi:MAG: cation:proton antiporter [Calditerrivibrio sp.]|nr:cation:proton antiporter [Calditerrivibrio sp.]